MKIITCISVLITVFLFKANGQTAREYRIPATNTRDGKLILKDFSGDLWVEGYDGKEIVFLKTSIDGKGSSMSKHTKDLNQSTKGMPDNSGIDLQIENSGNQITVKYLQPAIHAGEYKVKLPWNYSLKVVSNCALSKDISVSGLRNEVEINNCQSVKLVDINGSIVLSTVNGDIDLDHCTLGKDATLSLVAISGNIKAELSRVDTKEQVSINSISGDVILTLPAMIPASINLNSLSGMVKSEFDYPDKSKNQIIGTKINFTTNGGGVEIKISTVSGNISLRKGN